MAEEEDFLEDEEGEGEKEEGKKLPDKWIKILLYSGFFVGVIVISVFMSNIVFDIFKEANAKKSVVHEEVKDYRDLENFEIPDFRLTLDKQENEKLNTILQVKLFLAYDAENIELLEELKARLQEIRDTVQYITAKKNYKDIATAEKRETFLKEELKNGVNTLLKNGQIADVYFNTFVISRIQG